MDQQTIKTYDRAVQKLRFYLCWYRSLTADEFRGWLGSWILERIQIYSIIIKGVEEEAGKYKGPEERHGQGEKK